MKSKKPGAGKESKGRKGERQKVVKEGREKKKRGQARKGCEEGER